MQTFAQRQRQLQELEISTHVGVNVATLGLTHQEHPLLRLQRAIGNQAVQRVLQTYAEEAGKCERTNPTGRSLLTHGLTYTIRSAANLPVLMRQHADSRKAKAPRKHTAPKWELRLRYRHNDFEIVFDDFVFEREVLKTVFRAGTAPAGFQLAGEGGSAITTNWTLSISSDAALASAGELLDPLFAKQLADQRKLQGERESKKTKELDESSRERIQAARAAFRERHDSYSETVLDYIDAALERVTKNNPDLLVAYYQFYSDWKLTDDKVGRSSDNAGETDRTIRRGGFTDINFGVMHGERLPQLPTDDPLLLLGETLIHEYVHTSHTDDYLHAPAEGKAYGVENFFAERLGDTQREKITSVLGPKKGDPEVYKTSYNVMIALYRVMENGPSQSSNLMGTTAEEARAMSVEFVSKRREDFSDGLKKFIITEFGKRSYDSLP